MINPNGDKQIMSINKYVLILQRISLFDRARSVEKYKNHA